ncbi:MAG TPA: CocE/NonD family hydrolase [Steroidobacteraceae bacterium]
MMQGRLSQIAPELNASLTQDVDAPTRFSPTEIRRETLKLMMRDGVRLATDVYSPPDDSAPTIAVRTPYGRDHPKIAASAIAFAQCGYVVVLQDCRGTGESEPDTWDYYVYEREDSLDLVEWITHQRWYDGFITGTGGSYLAQTQWCMAFHPRMSAIAPEVGGLGVAGHSARLYMFLNAYARSVGKGADKLSIAYDELERQMLPETLAGGYFNEPLHQPFSAELLQSYPQLRSVAPLQAKRWLWEAYSAAPPAQRAQLLKTALGGDNVTITTVESASAVFGHHIAHDAHMFPCPDPVKLCQLVRAPALMITGWYDWGLNDTLATWDLMQRSASESVRSRSRLVISPSAHNVPGYHEGKENHPNLERTYRSPHLVPLLTRWYAAVRENTVDSWPAVSYYLMGADEWQGASAWPPQEAEMITLYLQPGGSLTLSAPSKLCPPDDYTYCPHDPTPTVGGSIVSYVYPPGSVDVSEVQRRSDVLTFTTARLQRALDVVGPLRLILFASSSAVDTDFVGRLSDVFPDGRAIQLQNGLLRARYRNHGKEPQLLQPGQVYRLEIDLWATANRFEAGHRLRLDISSADFPRFDRNANRGGDPDPPVSARQSIYHDPTYSSHLVLSVMSYPSFCE